MSEQKAELRRQMRRVRASISDRDARSLSLCRAVLDRVDQVVASAGHSIVVMAFVGVGTEPDTSTLLTGLDARGCVVVLPFVSQLDLSAVRWRPGAKMPIGAFGIPSPEGIEVDAASIDVVIVPGLAFTRDGRRLGQGGGFYDRFLPMVPAGCLTIGIGFAEQLVGDIPTEPHDRVLDAVVTDSVTK